jgi:Tfp pilus assembly protein PilN
VRESSTLGQPFFVDLNVLPEELRPRRYPAWFVVGVVTVLAAGLLLLPLSLVQQAASEETARLQSELALVNNQLAEFQIDLGRARDLRLQLETAEATIAGLNGERQAVLGDRRELSKDLSAMMEALPAGARVESITATDGPLSLTGQAGSPADALEYSRALVGTERFSEARITSLATAQGAEGGTGVTFTIEVTQ